MKTKAKSSRKSLKVRYLVSVVVASSLPLTISNAQTAGNGILQYQQGEQSGVISNIYTQKGRSIAALDGAEEKIWAAINANALQKAHALMQQTVRQYPGWQPPAEMEFVLLEKTIWAEIRVGNSTLARSNMSRLQARFGKGALAHKTQVALFSMRNVLEENRLWRLLGEGHLHTLQRAIRQIQASDPDFEPPHKMAMLLQQGLAAQSVGKLAREHAWSQIIALHAQTPSIFSLAYPGNRQALANALAATRHAGHATEVYISLLQHTQHADEAESLLNQAAGVLPPTDMQVLYQRAKAQFPEESRVFEKQHLQYVLMEAGRAHQAHHNARAAALVTPETAAIARLHQASDAALLGAVYGDDHQPQQALRWWRRAALWSGKASYWKIVGNLAMADNDASVAREAMEHLPAGSPASQHFERHEDVVAALRDYDRHDYAGTLKRLHKAQAIEPLSSGMETIEAWSLVHTRHFHQASRLFTKLYREHPTEGNAVGILISDQQIHDLAHSYQVASSVGGPLASHLPMATMRAHRVDINTIPWRFSASDQILPPPARQSYVALGGSWENRGGKNSGMTRMTEYLPSLQAQWGINWHMAAFAQVSSADIYGGQPNAGQLPSFSAPVTAQGVASGHVWQSPQFLLGIDDRESHHRWRAAIGWTSPSAIGGGTVQGLLRYTSTPSQSGSSWSVHVLRDSVRQTLLSYNGVHEEIRAVRPSGATLSIPYSWGAATRNQFGVSGYLSGGKTGWSYIGTLHLNAITGRNIQTDLGADTYLAAMKPVYTQGRWWITAGPSVYAETYSRNEDYASPGYGGYFSPQMMVQPSLTVSVSHWWTGGGVNLNAAIGYQWLHQAGGSYLGTASLRAQLAPELVAQNLAILPYGSSSGHNVAGSISVVLTQRLSNHWYVDAGASYQANPAFQQTQAGLDLRYVFGKQPKPTRTFLPAEFVQNLGRAE